MREGIAILALQSLNFVFTLRCKKLVGVGAVIKEKTEGIRFWQPLLVTKIKLKAIDQITQME